MNPYSWAIRVEVSDDWPLPRAEWGEGPWQEEPDLVEWRGKDTPYPLLILRGGMGALCGYVGVPEGHPFHGKSSVLGCNWASPCGGRRQPTGEPPTCWWLGFDCGHRMHSPIMEGFFDHVSRLQETHGLTVLGARAGIPRCDVATYVTVEKCRDRVEALATIYHVAETNPSVMGALLTGQVRDDTSSP